MHKKQPKEEEPIRTLDRFNDLIIQHAHNGDWKKFLELEMIYIDKMRAGATGVERKVYQDLVNDFKRFIDNFKEKEEE